MNDTIAKYGKSKGGNFEVVDTIGVPHPYCITPKHLEYSDSHILDKNSIEHAENKGAVCDICKKIHNKDYSKPILSFAEHKQALLVACYADPDKNQSEIKEFLTGIKDQCESDNYAGFAFVKKF
jgi:predicted GTPase